jgi:cardiolipin synthase (CMP-forming)
VNLRATGFRAAAVRERFRASRARGRAAQREHAAIYRSYLSWSVIGLLAVALWSAVLAYGARLAGAIVGGAFCVVWAVFWIWAISFHVGLVQKGSEKVRTSLGLPNVLTFLRIVLVPAVGWAIMAYGRLERIALPALIVIFLVGFSDVLDGVLARLLDWQTPFGRYLDHLADVLIMNAVAISEYAAGMLPGWLLALVVIRYAGTGIAGVVVLMIVPGFQIAPTWIGKVATFISGWTVFLTLAHTLGRWPLGVAMPWLFLASGVALGANIGILLYQVLFRRRSAPA